MGTPKRERQKVNRLNKIENQEKQLKRDLTKDRVIVVILCAIAAAVAIGLWVYFGDDASVEAPNTVVEEPDVPAQPLPTQLTEEPTVVTEPATQPPTETTTDS